MRKVAAIVLTAACANACMGSTVTSMNGSMVLDPSVSGAQSLSGGTAIQVPCVYVDSSSTSAVKGSGSALLDTPHLYAYGGCSFSGSSHCTGTTTKAPAPYSDPMASLVFPTTTGLTNLGAASVSGGPRAHPLRGADGVRFGVRAPA